MFLLLGTITGYFAHWLLKLPNVSHGDGVPMPFTALQGRSMPGTVQSNGIVRAAYDRNLDGKPDEFVFLTNGVVLEIHLDRRFLGVFDYFEYYTDGEIRSVYADDNLDGKIDSWSEFRWGRLSHLQRDLDRNDIPDSVTYYDGGMPRLTAVRPNGSSLPLQTLLYCNNSLISELLVDPLNPSKTNVFEYDVFEVRKPQSKE